MSITVLTAASSNHFKTVIQFLKSVPPSFPVIFYDIGLSNAEFAELKNKFPAVQHRTWDFSKYPDWMALSAPCSGAYAWKPLIISEVYSELKDGILLWQDSGNIMNNEIYHLKSIIEKNKIYSPTSSGTISTWTHPTALRCMKVPDSFLSLQKRNAAAIGLLCNDRFVLNFVNEFVELAQIKDVILPEGADRLNHRHDQSILTCLYYKYGIPREDRYIGFTIHNDVDPEWHNGVD